MSCSCADAAHTCFVRLHVNYMCTILVHVCSMSSCIIWKVLGVLARAALCTGLSAAGLLSSRVLELQLMTTLSCLYWPHQRLELQEEMLLPSCQQPMCLQVKI